MKKIILFFIIVGFLLPLTSFAATEKSSILPTNNISSLRTHSVTHANSSAQNVTMFWISGLEDGCTSLYLYSDKDPFLYSTALAGVTKETIATIKVFYLVDAERGPWGDNGSCKLTSFSIIK